MRLGSRPSFLALLAAGLLAVSASGCANLEQASADLQGSASEAQDADSSNVTETLSGQVEYLAPGEYIIDGQAFFVTEDTEILGGIYACADGTPPEDGSGTVPCDIDTFESALQSDMPVFAEVDVVEGNADTITEYLNDNGDSESPDGGSGNVDVPEDGAGGGESAASLSGQVEYLAPGEYIIDGQAFFVSEETEILGGIYACADGTPPEDGSGTVPCDIDTFESALQSDMPVHATVEVDGNGIAETITEELV
ncbi:hypothetical protein [Nocardiopsis coralliicola]